jgi:MFS family permease
MAKERLFTRNFVLCTVINFFFTMFFFMFFTGMSSFSMDVLGADSTLAGLTASIFIAGDLISRLIFGGRLDAIGKKRIAVGFLFAGTLLSFQYNFADSVTEVIILRFAHGLTYGAMASAVSAIVAEALPLHRRGEGMGYFTLSFSLGSAIGPFLCMYLQDSGTYADIFNIGVASSLLALVFALFLEDDGREPAETRSKGSFFEPSALPLSLIAFVFYLSYSGVLSFISPYGEAIGLHTYAVYFFVVLSTATLICRMFLSKIYDSKGENVALIPMFVMFIVGMAIFSTTGNGWMLLAAAFLMGFNVAQLNSVGQAVLVREAPKKRIAAAISMFSVFLDLAYAMGPVVNGQLIGDFGYRTNYQIMLVLAIASLVMYLVLHGMKHRSAENDGKQGV